MSIILTGKMLNRVCITFCGYELSERGTDKVGQPSFPKRTVSMSGRGAISIQHPALGPKAEGKTVQSTPGLPSILI